MRLSRRGKRRIVVVVALLVMAGGGIAGFKLVRSAQRDRIFAEARVEGLAAFEQGDLEMAIQKLSHYATRDNTDAEVMIAFASARSKVPMANHRHITEAIGLYKHVLGLLDADPTIPAHAEMEAEALRHLLDLYGMAGLNFEQIQIADRVLAEDPDNIRALEARATARVLERRHDEALADAKRLAELEPLEIRWRQLQLDIMRRVGHPVEEMIDLCDAWASEHETDGRFQVLAAGLLGNAGRIDEARVVMKDAAEQGADTLRVLEMMVGMLDELQMRDLAAQVIEDAKRRFADEQWVRQAIVQRHWQAARYEDALAELALAEQDFAELEPGLLRLEALLLISSGRGEEAKGVLDELRSAAAEEDDEQAEDRTVAWADAMSARLALGSEEWSAVMRRIDHAVALNPIDPTLHLARGEAYAAASENDQARDAFRDAFLLDPNWQAAGTSYVRALLQVGQPEEAFGVARQVLARSDRSTLGPFLVYARAYLAVLESGGEPGLTLSLTGISEDITRIFEEIQRQTPDLPEVASLLAEVYARSGRTDRATQFMQSTLDGDDPSAEVLLALARSSRRHGLGMESALLERARAEAGLTVPVAFALADLALDEGRPEQGLELIDQALGSAGEEIDPVQARQARISYLRRMQHPDLPEALRDFAEQFAGSSAAQSFVLSVPAAWEDADLVEQVIDRLREQLGERSQRARLARAQYLVRFYGDDEERLAEAITLLNGVLEQSPDSLAALTFMAEAWLHGDKPSLQRAVESLEKAVQVAPGRVELYPRLVALLQQQGDFEKAARYLQRLGRMAEHDERLQRTELQLLQQQGDFEAALVRASAIYDESSRETDQLALAAMHRRAGNLDEAEAIYQRLLRREEFSAIAIAEAADFYAETGRFERGLQLLKDLDSRSERINRPLLLGRYHARHGDAAEAENWLLLAVEQSPRSADVRHELARFYLSRGERAAARDQALLGLRLDGDHNGLKGALALANLEDDGGGRREAISILREMSGDNEDLLALLTLLERVPLKDGEPVPSEQVLEEVRRLVERHGSLPAAWNLSIRLHAQAGRMPEAIDMARRAVSRFPAAAEPAQTATTLLLGAGRWNEALVEAHEWRRRSLDDPMPADLVIARILLHERRPHDALRQLEEHEQRIRARSERNPDDLALLLRAQLAAGQTAETATVARPLLEGDAGWRSRWSSLALNLDDERADAALQMIPEELLSQPQELLQVASAWHQLALRTGSAAHFDRAEALANRAVASDQVRQPAMVLLGAIEEGQGNVAAAEAQYRAVIADHPDDPVALNNLGWVLVQMDRAAEALPLIERAMKAAGEEPSILDTLGNALRGAGRLEEAESVLQRAASSRPQDPAILLSLAAVLLDLGQTEQAEQRLRDALVAMEQLPQPLRSHRERATALQERLRQVATAAES